MHPHLQRLAKLTCNTYIFTEQDTINEKIYYTVMLENMFCIKTISVKKSDL